MRRQRPKPLQLLVVLPQMGSATTSRPRSAQGRQKAARRKARAKRHEITRQQGELVAHKLRMVAASTPVEELPEVDPATAMQLVINRTQFLLRAAEAEVNKLKPGLARNQADNEHELWPSWDDNGNLVVSANYWVSREETLRNELARMTEAAQRIGLSERRTRVAEAQVMQLGEALKAVCDAIKMPIGMQRQLGKGLREHFDAEAETIEVGA